MAPEQSLSRGGLPSTPSLSRHVKGPLATDVLRAKAAAERTVGTRAKGLGPLGCSSRPCSIISGNERVGTSRDLSDRHSGLIQIASDAEAGAARRKKLGKVVRVGTA